MKSLFGWREEGVSVTMNNRAIKTSATSSVGKNALSASASLRLNATKVPPPPAPHNTKFVV